MQINITITLDIIANKIIIASGKNTTSTLEEIDSKLVNEIIESVDNHIKDLTTRSEKLEYEVAKRKTPLLVHGHAKPLNLSNVTKFNEEIVSRIFEEFHQDCQSLNASFPSED